MAGLTREQQQRKMAAELAVALAAKPPASAAKEEEYVPPPVVNLQSVIPNPRRKPLPSEQDQTAVRETAQKQVEEAKNTIAADTKLAYMSPADFEAHTAELRVRTEAAHTESVRMLKVQWAKAQAVGAMPKYDVEVAHEREQKAHLDNLDFVKSEMARSIHTEDYSG
jgi:hypothetical protein